MSPTALASSLKLMAFDIDGVMTDGSLYFTENGTEFKAFNTLDGHGLKMLQQAGITLAIITGRSSGAVAARAANLGIEHLYQGVHNKQDCLFALLETLGLQWAQAGYMGDDIVDLPVMNACGFSACPANAHPLVRQHARFATQYRGGQGAVREVCDFILSAQKREDILVTPYLTFPRSAP